MEINPGSIKLGRKGHLRTSRNITSMFTRWMVSADISTGPSHLDLLTWKAVPCSSAQVSGFNEPGIWKYSFPHYPTIALREISYSLRRKVVSLLQETISLQVPWGDAIESIMITWHNDLLKFSCISENIDSWCGIELCSTNAILHSRNASSVNASKSSFNFYYPKKKLINSFPSFNTSFSSPFIIIFLLFQLFFFFFSCSMLLSHLAAWMKTQFILPG